ncbi:MAG: phosphonopyruvate decarboxylase [Defluviitaleaceae bacterium]|nr:phosphonopyruvate decarboxylase [Defluviitaleaceae bacterium]
MDIKNFLSILKDLGGSFYAGVPDSLLTPFIDAIVDTHGVGDSHIVAANEGAAVGLAAGHYLATSRPAIVYMQNSGIGNAVNPIASLLHKKVYSIPVIFVIGWRGEPGIKDEPQHVFQGESTLSLLECLEIPHVVISKENHNLNSVIQDFKQHISRGQSVAFVICKDALQNNKKMKYTSDATLSREDALKIILANTGEDATYVCTTGKLSREVFEIRVQNGDSHAHDFLTVGSMGHSLMIAHGIALAKPKKRIFCLDGDGAILMHMGSLAVVGTRNPKNLVHIVINNGAHETVGGLPAVSNKLNLCNVAKALGYSQVFQVSSNEVLQTTLNGISNSEGSVFVEIICNLLSRTDLGRPTTTPIQNKNDLMENLK